MSAAQHTPGPWVVGVAGPNGCVTIGTQEGLMVAIVTHSLNYPEQKEQAIGDANVIAAAPELLEAAERVDAAWTALAARLPQDDAIEAVEWTEVQQLRAAIRKARVEA